MVTAQGGTVGFVSPLPSDADAQSRTPMDAKSGKTAHCRSSTKKVLTLRKPKKQPHVADRMQLAVATATTLHQSRRVARRQWIIDPRQSTHLFIWDIIALCALMFVACVTPYEVGFLEPSTSPSDPLFILNRVIDAVFILDLVLQFLLMVEAPHDGELRWISEPRLIARHYLSTWFTLDIVCVLVSSIDYVSLLNKDSDVNNLRLLRVLRTLRLMKLTKLFSSLKIIKRYEVKFAINYAALSLIRCLVAMLLTAHWFACIWGLQASFSDSKLDTWLGVGDYCAAHVAIANVTGSITCEPPFVQYVASLYWSVMTITSIGYGDISATAGNTPEQFVALTLMIVGSIGQGLVLGTIVSNLSSIDPEKEAFTNTMTELNKMMSREGLRNDLRIRLREYFHETHHIRRADKRTALLELMSPTLRSEVAWELNKSWLGRVWFLQGASLAFLVQLSLNLKPLVFSPGEIAPSGKLYIVNRGLSLFGGIIYSRGKYWGEDVILTSDNLRLTYCALAMNFLEVFTLARGDLEKAAAIFPSMAKRLRQCSIRLAVRRAFMLEAQRRAEPEALPPSASDFLSKGRTSLVLKSSGRGYEGDEEDAVAAVAKARSESTMPTANTRQRTCLRRVSTMSAAKSSKVAEDRNARQESEMAAAAVGAAMASNFTEDKGSLSAVEARISRTSGAELEAPPPLQPQAQPSNVFGVFSSVFAAPSLPAPAPDLSKVSSVVADALQALRGELRPLIEANLANQEALRSGLDQQREATQAIANDISRLSKLVVPGDDMLRKLRA